MCTSTLVNSLLELPGVRVKAAVCDGELQVRVQLRCRRLRCPLCGFRTRQRCPEHGVLAEGVPFARPDSRRTVGAICERVVVDVLDSGRLCGLVDIGVD